MDYSSDRSTSIQENGEMKLLKAKTSLGIAQKEANKTLMPILESMQKSRLIKSTEKLIDSVYKILEYPNQMNKLYEKEDYYEVIKLNKQVCKLIEEFNQRSSLKIIANVKTKVDEIVKKIRLKCVSVLTDNLVYNANRQAINNDNDDRLFDSLHNTTLSYKLSSSALIDSLLRYSNVLREIDGDEGYREHLRLCFFKQCQYLYTDVKYINDKFITQSIRCLSSIDNSADDQVRGNFETNKSSSANEVESSKRNASMYQYEYEVMNDLLQKWSKYSQLSVENLNNINDNTDNSIDNSHAKINKKASIGTASDIDSNISLYKSILRKSEYPIALDEDDAFDYDVNKDVDSYKKFAKVKYDQIDEFQSIFMLEDSHDRDSWYSNNFTAQINSFNANKDDFDNAPSSSNSYGLNKRRQEVDKHIMKYILVTRLRLNHLYQLIDCIKLWIPCLHRLVS